MSRYLAAAFALAVAVTPLAPADAALHEGAKAPDFQASASLDGNAFRFSLSQALKKGPVVLYFFPKAFTSGCTVEAHAFSDATPEFNKLGATVIGMSTDTVPDLQRFSAKECRNKFTVASATPDVVAAYDVALKDHPGITDRTSYVIDKKGRIVFAYSAMDPEGHVTGTMDAVKKLVGKN